MSLPKWIIYIIYDPFWQAPTRSRTKLRKKRFFFSTPANLFGSRSNLMILGVLESYELVFFKSKIIFLVFSRLLLFPGWFDGKIPQNHQKSWNSWKITKIMKIHKKSIFLKITVYVIYACGMVPESCRRLQKSFGLHRNLVGTLRNIFLKIDFSSIFLIFVNIMNFMFFMILNFESKLGRKW